MSMYACMSTSAGSGTPVQGRGSGGAGPVPPTLRLPAPHSRAVGAPGGPPLFSPVLDWLEWQES